MAARIGTTGEPTGGAGAGWRAVPGKMAPVTHDPSNAAVVALVEVGAHGGLLEVEVSLHP